MMKTSPKNKGSIHLMFTQTKDFIFYVLSMIIVVTLSIVEIVIAKLFVDEIIVNEGTEISLYVAPFILTFIVISVFMVIRTKAKVMIIANISSNLQKKAYNSILSSEIADTKKDENKKLINRIVNNSQLIADYYIGSNILPFIETFAILFAILLSSLIVQPIFGVVMLLLTPFYIVAVKGIEIFSLKIVKHYEVTLSNNQDKINDSYDKLKNIKLLNGAEHEKENLNELANDYVSAFSSKNIFKAFSKTVMIVLFVGLLLSIALGIGGLLKDSVSPGTFIFYIVATPSYFILLYQELHYRLMSEKVDKAEQELETVISLRSENKSEPVTNLDEIHTVKFKEMVYITDNNKKVLNKVTFEIKRGEKIGIYSLDKESKHAIAECLTKLTRPKEGEISINNCDLTKISPIYLRTIITSVFEDSCVFNETILHNVCYPENFDEYKYNDALYRSGLKDAIAKLEDKENTIVNNAYQYTEKLDVPIENFVKRLVFANAFYKDSKIYLLNDATSGLSPTMETELLNEIFKLKNKIVIMLTDKTYLLSKCDKILILENGEQVEYGKYDELITNKESTFYKMIKRAPSKKAKIS